MTLDDLIAAYVDDVERRGRTGVYLRAWHIQITAPGHSEWPEITYRNDCTPTLLMGQPEEDAREYRGACLGCGWVGSPRDWEHPAVEDAHDHAWDGWRSLPVVDERPDPGPRWRRDTVATLEKLYPDGWAEEGSGAPILTVRHSRHGTRHIPSHSPWGGYDLCAEVRDDHRLAGHGGVEQGELF